MKRKYNNPPVKVGEFVYWSDGYEESKFAHKVIKKTEIYITIEMDRFDISDGWPNPELGNSRYWNVILWTKAKKDYRMSLE